MSERNFTKIIPALNAAGYSNLKLAYLCRASESVIRKWAKGESEPTYSKAVILIALYEKYCREEKSNADGGS